MRCYPVGDRAICGEVIELDVARQPLAGGAGLGSCCRSLSPICRCSSAGVAVPSWDSPEFVQL